MDFVQFIENKHLRKIIDDYLTYKYEFENELLNKCEDLKFMTNEKFYYDKYWKSGKGKIIYNKFKFKYEIKQDKIRLVLSFKRI
jgi:hypothetical protein